MYVNFTPDRHPLRLRALAGLAKNLHLEAGREVANFNASRQEDFWEALVDSKFVLSPPGIVINFYN